MRNLETYSAVNKAKYEVEEKMDELDTAKDQHRLALIEETKKQLMDILATEGTLKERDFDIFLRDLSVNTMQLYARR